MAVGVARPKAHGQEITSTEIPMERANSAEYPNNSQTILAATAMEITIGTNTPLTLSASFAIGALEELASSTSLMIWAKAVSSPTCVARNLIYPDLLMPAPVSYTHLDVYKRQMLSASFKNSTAPLPASMANRLTPMARAELRIRDEMAKARVAMTIIFTLPSRYCQAI